MINSTHAVGARVAYRFWNNQEFVIGTVIAIHPAGSPGDIYRGGTAEIKRDGYHETAVMPLVKFDDADYVMATDQVFNLTISECGTVHNTATSTHYTFADAHHALARFARGYDIQGYGTMGGTLTTRSGRVNQASYVWTIRTIKTGN